MKALTIQQPRAELIMQGRKSIELRKWRTKHRGLLAILAGKTVDTGQCRKHGLDPDKLTKGAIVGTVEMEEIIEFSQELWGKLRDQHLSDESRPGKWKGWKLQNPQRLEPPIACRGLRGVFDLPEDVATEIQLVQRITVDEILADNLIRFEVCDLSDDVKSFLYEASVWKKDEGLVVRGETYEVELGIPYPWDVLEEGQVFLFGNFEVIGDRDKPKEFRVNREKHEFLRIDQIDDFRDQLRTLYSEVLRMGERTVK